MKKIKILGISGSLRKESYNLALLRAAAKLLPPEVELEIITLENIPLYNQDLEYTNIPAITDFKAKIKSADALLFSSPEYNYSIPGVLKNALDVASRPWGENSFAGKPAAIMGASVGNIATARMQYHLRQCLVFLDMYPINKPEVMIGMAQDKIDEKGEINDDKTKEKIAEMLVALVEWTNKLA
ncbi:MAG: NAD(P)H-dependent oxidoreductase [Candidatus Falkowbacteria bacterium]